MHFTPNIYKCAIRHLNISKLYKWNILLTLLLNTSSELNSVSFEFQVSSSMCHLTWEGSLFLCSGFRISILTESSLLPYFYICKFIRSGEWVSSLEFNDIWSLTVVFNNRVNRKNNRVSRRSHLLSLKMSRCRITHFKYYGVKCT